MNTPRDGYFKAIEQLEALHRIDTTLPEAIDVLKQRAEIIFFGGREEPLPCMFCGGTRSTTSCNRDNIHWVKCLGAGCAATGPIRAGARQAIAAWNSVARTG